MRSKQTIFLKKEFREMISKDDPKFQKKSGDTDLEDTRNV